jgi:carbamoyltransferase
LLNWPLRSAIGRFRLCPGVPNFANYEASASLIRVPRGGGEIAYVSIAEDRLTRTKHTYAFPLRGIQYCLESFGLESIEQIDFIYTDYARLPRWMNSGPGYRKLEHDYLKLRLRYPRERIRVVDHHDGHAGAAFHLSPFDEAAVLVVDSLGSRLNTQTLYHFRPDGAHVLERGNTGASDGSTRSLPARCCRTGPRRGSARRWAGAVRRGASWPGARFQGRDAGMSSDYSAFFSRPPLPRIVARGVRRCEDREQVLDPYFARAAYDVQQECERQMVRMADVRVREDRQPQPVHRRRHRSERPGQRPRAAALALRERVDSAGLLRHGAVARPGAVGLFPGRRGGLEQAV